MSGRKCLASVATFSFQPIEPIIKINMDRLMFLILSLHIFSVNKRIFIPIKAFVAKTHKVMIVAINNCIKCSFSTKKNA